MTCSAELALEYDRADGGSRDTAEKFLTDVFTPASLPAEAVPCHRRGNVELLADGEERLEPSRVSTPFGVIEEVMGVEARCDCCP